MLAVLLVSAGLTGLYAGVHVGFSIAVMPGLARAGDDVFVAGMRGINRAIQNPVFGGLFVLSPVLAVIAALLAPSDPLRWTAAALVVAANTLTLVVNVPLNTRLDETTAPSTDARRTFERPWNRAHTVRTAALVGSFAAALVAVGLESGTP